MAFLDLPNEIILYIAELLEYESEINALSRINRALHTLLTPSLYRHNVLYGDSSAMAWGITHESLATIQNLLNAGASADERDAGVAWRHMAPAAIHGHEEILRFLWHSGVDIHRDKGWMNPRLGNYNPELPGSILFAAERGHESIVRLNRNLSTEKGDVDYPVSRDGRTPLAEAAAGGHLSIVKFLLDEGAQPGALVEYGANTLEVAVDRGRADVM